MTPPVDPLLEPLINAPDAGPSMAGAVLRMTVAVILVAAAGWAWLYWHRKVKGPTRHVEVIDRAMLARGASVALVRVDEKRLLLGVSGEGVRLLRDLGKSGADVPAAGFPQVLEDAAARQEAQG